MNNPFDLIDVRLSHIETLLLDIKHGTIGPEAKVKPSEIPPIYGVKTCKEVTGFAIATIYRNTSKNLMPHYRRDGKLFFKRDEIYAWMTETQVKTTSQFLDEVDAKLLKRKTGK